MNSAVNPIDKKIDIIGPYLILSLIPNQIFPRNHFIYDKKIFVCSDIVDAVFCLY